MHAVQDIVNQKDQKELRKNKELQQYIIKCKKKERKKEEVERCINRLRLSFEFHLKVILSTNKLHLFKMSDLRDYFCTFFLRKNIPTFHTLLHKSFLHFFSSSYTHTHILTYTYTCAY